MQIREKQQSQT